MKEYPSIPSKTPDFDAYMFDKLDGSNLRFEYSKKQGFYKFGTRHRRFDASDPTYGAAISLFQRLHEERLTRLAVDSRWESLVVFAEYWGKQSLGGQHVPGDPMTLTLFDLAPYKRGILGPREYLRLTEGWDNCARLVCTGTWTQRTVELVRAGGFGGLTFEGVVGKGGEGHHILRAKAKTQDWIDAILARYGSAGMDIVNS